MDVQERQIIRLAVPCEEPGGLDAPRSGHFGKSPCFTMVDVVDNVVVSVFSVSNDRHDDGDGCLTPVLTLGEHMVDVVIVAGIGRQPLLACLQSGIRVLGGEDRPDVRSVIGAFVGAELAPAGIDATAVH